MVNKVMRQFHVPLSEHDWAQKRCTGYITFPLSLMGANLVLQQVKVTSGSMAEKQDYEMTYYIRTEGKKPQDLIYFITCTRRKNNGT
eukprot:8048122-Ditylum_brightwellii.AAC.1